MPAASQPSPIDPYAGLLQASLWHGGLEEARNILSEHPQLESNNLYTAALLGNAPAVQFFLGKDLGQVNSKENPAGLDALTLLCFSRFLRLDPARHPGFLAAARALLEAGANANTGLLEGEFEPVLYAASSVAFDAELTGLLLDFGANPNDGETPYHAAETRDLAVLRVLLKSGKLDSDSLATLLLRKADWHDLAGMELLIEHGADPNRMTAWKYTALHQAMRRDNSIEAIRLLLEHGADPNLPNRVDGLTPLGIAARRGRADVLTMVAERGMTVTLPPVDQLIAACALSDAVRIHFLAGQAPLAVAQLQMEAGKLLGQFAGNDNASGLMQLISLGIAPDSLDGDGDSYFGIAPGSNALHVAAWRGAHRCVRYLIEQGLPVDAKDGAGRTALQLAVKAATDSYWMAGRRTDSVAALLEAGAGKDGVKLPTGYAEMDALLAG